MLSKSAWIFPAARSRNIIAACALRDKRLLPKVKSPARQLGFTKKKKVMSVSGS